MHILIEKDSATKVPREVKDIEVARAIQSQGFTVHLVNGDNSLSPLPADEAAAAVPAKKVAAEKPAAKKAPAKTARKR